MRSMPRWPATAGDGLLSPCQLQAVNPAIAGDPCSSSSLTPLPPADGGLHWQEDLKHLRTLWDMVAVVMGKFDEWQSTLWNDIDVDALIEATKQLAKDVRTLNKAVRAFEVYK